MNKRAISTTTQMRDIGRWHGIIRYIHEKRENQQRCQKHILFCILFIKVNEKKNRNIGVTHGQNERIWRHPIGDILLEMTVNFKITVKFEYNGQIFK